MVVSPTANGLNHHMGTAPERAHLIDKHLAMLQQLTTTGKGLGALPVPTGKTPVNGVTTEIESFGH
ncbi:hypothetical protein [Actinoplanes derwentensis]|uniref:Uncharacterized protein n=1 Tax=Actinoplanes derwentensis TaxID=113562 RepID=A0A1H2CRJ6_9ACTN|nr:hypothetical protein [Actinoplanes derwentensis]GID89852.1 hypothetical protein Ade03nite_87760 [Actinoplanes derwentensis]SDT72974.1 hypothetical protein SAMN04489716_6537 [Actinoplanes derwentensis]